MGESGSRPVSVLGMVVVGAGAVGFVSGLLPWYGSEASVFGLSGSVTVDAWNAGAGAWLTVVLLSGAGVVALTSVLSRPLRTPVWSILPAVLSTLAALCLVARWVSWSDSSNGAGGVEGVTLNGSWLNGVVQASAGPELGFYLAMVAVAVAVVASWLGARGAIASSYRAV